MSDAPVETVVRETEERRPLTPDASNLLGWWWLAIVFAIVLLVAIWPSLFTDQISSFGNFTLLVISAGVVAWAAVVAWGFARAKEWSAGAMRLTAIVGLAVGLAAVAFFLYSVAFAAPPTGSPSFWGPTPILSGILWVVLIVLPFIFGLLIIFGLMSDGVDQWYHPPLVESPTATNLRVDPQTAAIMAGGAGAVSHAVSEEGLIDELSQVMTIDDATSRRRPVRRTDGDEQSVEVIGTAGDELSVEVVGGPGDDEGSLAELAALEQALSEDKDKKAARKKKKDEKKKPSKGDEPLSVDDDFKL
jgi:hypothetical protein